MGIKITTTPKFKEMILKDGFKGQIPDMLEQIGLLILGKQTESSFNTKNAPFRQAFGKFKAPTNKVTQSFKKLSPEYAKTKTKTKFLIESGNLFKDVIVNAKIKTTNTSLTITAKAGKSKEYQNIHQYGGKVKVPAIKPKNKKSLHFKYGGKGVFANGAKAHTVKIPARPYYQLNSVAIKKINAFTIKHLNRIFGKQATGEFI